MAEHRATLEEVATHLRLNRRTIERYIKQGWLPVIRLSGRTMRFDLAEVDKAVAKHSTELAGRTE